MIVALKASQAPSVVVLDPNSCFEPIHLILFRRLNQMSLKCQSEIGVKDFCSLQEERDRESRRLSLILVSLVACSRDVLLPYFT